MDSKWYKLLRRIIVVSRQSFLCANSISESNHLSLNPWADEKLSHFKKGEKSRTVRLFYPDRMLLNPE